MTKKIYFLFVQCLVMYLGIQLSNGQTNMLTDKSIQFKDYVSIPMAGNSWANYSQNDSSEIITDSGIARWKNLDRQVQVCFRTGVTGKIHLALRARNSSGSSTLKFQFGKENRTIRIGTNLFDTLYIGSFTIKNPGYQSVIISGKEKTSDNYPEISDLLLFEESTDNQLSFVKNDFYWGRRGPSVHLNYPILAAAGDIEWFNAEINVPPGNDVPGSYFMATGFGEGYFGMQVNSETERRILFSVWSPAKTDNPNEIPADEKIVLLKKGNRVHAGSFGDEGSGGQSYSIFQWKAGVNYNFLIKGIPSENNSTDYTAWFFAPEKGYWELIASFRRPKTTTYLSHLHSFLENFVPEKGNITRMGIYSNQWVCNSKGDWIELNTARFTADATARKGARLDFMGGLSNSGFFLKNCGFFTQNTEIDSWLTRPLTKKPPAIDFLMLP